MSCWWMRAGPDLPSLEILTRHFSYFTIQSNVLAASVLTVFAIRAARRARQERPSRPFTQLAVAVYMVTVVLRPLRAPGRSMAG
jgi:hypothetical protein